MAWSRVSGATLTADIGPVLSATFNLGTLGAAVQAGDRIMASICVFTASTPSGVITGIADDLGNTWVQHGSNLYNLTVLHEFWSTSSAAGTPANITVTMSAAETSLTAALATFRGIDTSGTPLDVAALFGQVNGSGTADSGTTAGTTTAANELKVGIYGDDGRGFTPVAGTVDTTYTRDVVLASSGAGSVAIESADSGTSGSTAQATMTSANTTRNSMYVAVFKLSAAATGWGPLLGLQNNRLVVAEP